MQSGVGVFKGDLDYYFAKGDLRNGLFKMEDPKACPMYLLTGEYDWSASPAITQEILRANPEAKFQYMKELGHFPMSENPKRFLRASTRCSARSSPTKRRRPPRREAGGRRRLPSTATPEQSEGRRRPLRLRPHLPRPAELLASKWTRAGGRVNQARFRITGCPRGSCPRPSRRS